MINYTRDHSVADGLRYIAGWQTGMFQRGDMMEEFAAKAEKRDPKFEEIPPGPPARHLRVRTIPDTASRCMTCHRANRRKSPSGRGGFATGHVP